MDRPTIASSGERDAHNAMDAQISMTDGACRQNAAGGRAPAREFVWWGQWESNPHDHVDGF